MRLHQALKDILGSDFRKAAAKIVGYDEEGRPVTEDIDFVKHRITRRMNVAVTDKEGNPVRISSAFYAIYRAAEALHDELYDV
jgi:hypothetical protein